MSDHDPTDGHDLLTEPADSGAGNGWRRHVIIAAVVLACLGAMVGTAFGLANAGTGDDGDDSAGAGPTPSVSVEASPEPAPSVSAATESPGGGGECTANCGGNQNGNKSVPHVVGHDESGAKSKVSNAGLSPKVQYVCDDHGGGEPGKVTAQDPSGGTSLASGKTVTLSVRGMKVPNVVGQYKDYAKEQLTEQGFGTNTTTKTSSEQSGIVLSQSPAGGSCIKHGSTVTITIPGAAQASPSVAA